MVESEEMARDIKEIKWHTDAIDSQMELLIIANRKPILDEIMTFFGKSKRRAEVYLAVDGKRSVEDITKLLGMKKPNVSAQLMKLARKGLVEKKRVTTEGYVVYKKRLADRILGISRKLKARFGIP